MLLVLSLIMLISVLIIPISIYSYSKYITEVNKPIPPQPVVDRRPKEYRSLDETIKNLDLLINLTWKYNETYHFKLLDITHPRVEDEIARLTHEVEQNMSDSMKEEVLYHFSDWGFVRMISRSFLNLIYQYMIDRNGLQGIYHYLLSENREKVKKDLEETRKKIKKPRLHQYNNKNGKPQQNNTTRSRTINKSVNESSDFMNEIGQFFKDMKDNFDDGIADKYCDKYYNKSDNQEEDDDYDAEVFAQYLSSTCDKISENIANNYNNKYSELSIKSSMDNDKFDETLNNMGGVLHDMIGLDCVDYENSGFDKDEFNSIKDLFNHIE